MRQDMWVRHNGLLLAVTPFMLTFAYACIIACVVALFGVKTHAQTPVCVEDSASRKVVERINSQLPGYNFETVGCSYRKEEQVKLDFTVEHRSERKPEPTRFQEARRDYLRQQRQAVVNASRNVAYRTPGLWTADRYSGGIISRGIDNYAEYKSRTWANPIPDPPLQLRVVRMKLFVPGKPKVDQTVYFKVDQNDSYILAWGFEPNSLSRAAIPIGVDPETELMFHAFRLINPPPTRRLVGAPSAVSAPQVHTRPRRVNP